MLIPVARQGPPHLLHKIHQASQKQSIHARKGKIIVVDEASCLQTRCAWPGYEPFRDVLMVVVCSRKEGGLKFRGRRISQRWAHVALMAWHIRG